MKNSFIQVPNLDIVLSLDCLLPKPLSTYLPNQRVFFTSQLQLLFEFCTQNI